jgi:hypothetical protein
VRVADGKLYHPDGAWDPDTVYVPVYSKRESSSLSYEREGEGFPFIANASEVKRKGFDEQDETTGVGPAKAQRSDNRQEAATTSDRGEEDEADRRCVDLIVLGISYHSAEADVRKCFEIFGELALCEVTTPSIEKERFF